MSEPMEPIQLTLGGVPEFGDLVPVSTFLEAVKDWITSLQRTTDDIAPRRQTVEWLLAEVERGSAVVKINPFALAPDGSAIATQALRQTVVAINTIQSGGDPAKIVSAKAAEPLLRLVKLVDSHAIPEIRVRSGVLSTDIYPRVPDVNQTRLHSHRAIGSIDGSIVSVSFASLPHSFTVRERLDSVLVPCYFDSDRLYDAVIGNLRRRVIVAGMVTRRSDGVASFVTEVERIEPFPSKRDLPQPDDIAGIDHDFTEGLPAEEYIRRRRA